VRVNDDSGNIERVTQDDVCRFASDAGEPGQLFHRCWDLAAKFFNQLLRATLQRFCLGAKKSERANERLDLSGAGLGKLFWIRITVKKLRGDLVDRLVGALGRKNDRDEKLEGIAMRERNLELRVELGETRSDDSSPGAFFRQRFPVPAPDFGLSNRMNLRQLTSRAGPKMPSFLHKLLGFPVPPRS